MVPRPLTRILQQRGANLLVVPVDQWRGDPERSDFGIHRIHGLFDGPARGALARFARDTGRWGRQARRLAHVRLLFHLHEELTYHIATEELVVRGAPQRQALRRLDDFHAVAQRP